MAQILLTLVMAFLLLAVQVQAQSLPDRISQVNNEEGQSTITFGVPDLTDPSIRTACRSILDQSQPSRELETTKIPFVHYMSIRLTTQRQGSGFNSGTVKSVRTPQATVTGNSFHGELQNQELRSSLPSGMVIKHGKSVYHFKNGERIDMNSRTASVIVDLGDSGGVVVDPPLESSDLAKHGGPIRLGAYSNSSSTKGLTYADGTPYFFVEDSVSRFPENFAASPPSEQTPIASKPFVDEYLERRKAQGRAPMRRTNPDWWKTNPQMPQSTKPRVTACP